MKQISERNLKSLTILGVVACAVVVSLPGSFSTEVLNPDGQRYLFNGILVHDLIRDGALADIHQYATRFYAQYPAFNLPYGPPFLAAQFALVFGVFGISVAVARLLIVGYTVASALICWYMVKKVDGDGWIAFTAFLLFLCNPLTLYYSRSVASELPVIFFSLAALYTGYQYVEEEKPGYGIGTALLLSLGFLTKQHIVPLGFGIFFYMLMRRKFSLIIHRETIAGGLILLLFTLPYTILTMYFTSEDMGVKLFPPISLELLFGYFLAALQEIPFLLILAFCGFVLALVYKNRLCQLCLCWVLAWYIFFTFIYGYYVGQLRYILVILPALVYPAVLTIQFVLKWKSNRYSRIILVIGLAIYSCYNVYHTPINFVRGYAEAGQFIGRQQPGMNVLYLGHYDGNFLYGIRRECRKKSPFVLRGDQWLATRLWWGELQNPDTVKKQKQILNMLQQYSVGHVVVETGNDRLSAYPEYQNLLRLIEADPDFRRVKQMPVQSNVPRLMNRSLIIYKTPFSAEPNTSRNSIPIMPSALRDKEL